MGWKKKLKARYNKYMEEEILEEVLKKEKVLDWVKIGQFGVFLAILIALPFLKNQLITGSLVNALFFISASMLGFQSAFLLCFVPSLVSVYAGLLPILLAPVIPFIIAGNALLMFVFIKLKHRGFWQGAVFASLAKFAFIWLVGMILANSVLHGISKVVMQIISWPQLATAIAGSAIAFLFFKIIKKI